MIVGIEGGLGTGKTILLTRYLVKDYNRGFKIYSNYGLKHIECEPLDINELLDMEKGKVKLFDVSIGIDELTVFADCRRSSKKMNLMISYLYLQSRKRNTNIYFTTQNFSMIDWRLLEHCSIEIFCDHVRDENKKVIDRFKKYTIFDKRDPHNVKIARFVMDISKYYRFYDTNEIILPPV